MSKIIIIGTNHKMADVELRERLSFSPDEILESLIFIKEIKGIKECLIFSTCNRTEILYIPEKEEKIDEVIDFISKCKKIRVSDFKEALYILKADNAIRHIFKVASSLDSMVIGEPQILGQIKQAYRAAVENNSSGVLLNRLMHKSFNIAKKIRRETGIGDNAVSVSYAAIELANKIFSDLSTKSVMLLGAGEMADLAVEHLISNNVKKITVANRTLKNAVKLARKFNGQAIRFEEREDALSDADIVISSTGATEYILTAEQVKRAMKKRKHNTIFFIDIAVPRDIDPKINDLSNVYLYDMDDLANIVKSNKKKRMNETVKAEMLIEEGVVRFRGWLDNLAIVPTIKAINDKISSIAEIECNKTLSTLKHISEKDAEAIRRMTQAISSRTIHDPIAFLKNIGNHRNDSLYLSVTRQIFNLNISEKD